MKIPLHLEFPHGKKAPSRQPQALVPPANIPVTPSVAPPQKSSLGGANSAEPPALLPAPLEAWDFPEGSPWPCACCAPASAQPSPPRGWLSWKGPPRTGFSEMPCPDPTVVRGGLRFLLANFSLVQDGLPRSLMVKKPQAALSVLPGFGTACSLMGFSARFSPRAVTPQLRTPKTPPGHPQPCGLSVALCSKGKFSQKWWKRAIL